jgi:hypothetical protein
MRMKCYAKVGELSRSAYQVAAVWPCRADRGVFSLHSHGGRPPPPPRLWGEVMPAHLASEYSCYLQWGFCYMGQVETIGREQKLASFESHQRSTFRGYLSEIAHPVNIGGPYLGCGGDIVHLCLRPDNATVQRGTAATPPRSPLTIAVLYV